MTNTNEDRALRLFIEAAAVATDSDSLTSENLRHVKGCQECQERFPAVAEMLGDEEI